MAFIELAIWGLKNGETGNMFTVQTRDGTYWKTDHNMFLLRSTYPNAFHIEPKPEATEWGSKLFDTSKFFFHFFPVWDSLKER